MKTFGYSIIAAILLSGIPLQAQDDRAISAIVALTGADDAESLDESEVERYSHLLAHPLDINHSGISHLVSSGILTQYQAASLLDYRRTGGDVLSLSELASIDGFGRNFVTAIAPFIIICSDRLPGQMYPDSSSTSQNLIMRTAFKGGKEDCGMKWRMSWGQSAEASLSLRSGYEDSLFPPASHTFNASYFGHRWLGKVIVGDFNARFGQGLSMWSGMSMTGFSSSASFYRRSTGLSSCWSYSAMGSHRGVAADFQLGRFVLSSFASFPGLRKKMISWGKDSKTEISFMPGASLSWYGRNGQLSLTGYHDFVRGGKISADGRWTVHGSDIFSELGYDFLSGRIAAVGGAVIPVADGWKASFVARNYPAGYSDEYASGVRNWTRTSDERGVAAGLEHGACVLTVDYAQKASDKDKHQLKGLLKVPFQIGPDGVLSFRVTERYRPYEPYLKFRTGARCDFDWSSAGISAVYGESDGPAWKARIRLEGVLCSSLAGITYIEGGRKTDSFSAYLRGTVFFVDNWDDRIYSYERDAPGNFNVKAFYGRGYALSAVGGIKIGRGRRHGFLGRTRWKAYLRASTVRYDFMKTQKKPETDLRLQLMADFL